MIEAKIFSHKVKELDQRFSFIMKNYIIILVCLFTFLLPRHLEVEFISENPWLAGGHNGLSNSENPLSPQPPYPRVKELRSLMKQKTDLFILLRT